MKKSINLVIAMILVLSMFVVACGGGQSSPEPSPAPAPGPSTNNQGTPADESKGDEPEYGGVVTMGTITPFKGVFEQALSEGTDDSTILDWSMESLFDYEEDLTVVPKIASWTTSDDNTVFTFTFKEGVKWHNGEELTVHDWKFAFDVLAHADYTGPRWSSVSLIAGSDEYKAGENDEISGIRVIDDYNIEITFKEALVNTMERLWKYPMPRKHYEGVPIAELAESPQVRQNPIGIGPFKIVKIEPGEYVQLERFDDYYQGKPYLDGVVVRVVDGAMITALLEKGEIDYVGVPASQFPEAEKLNNVTLFTYPARSYSYIGFKLGHWDEEKGTVVMDNPKFQNKKLRQALAYAIDRQQLIDSFNNGLGTVLNVPFAATSWAKLPDSEVNAYPYDQEKAKQLLDEAGYIDIDGDGFREDPDGNKFTMTYMAMEGTETSEPRALAIIDAWREIGIDASLHGGGLKDFNVFYDLVDNDDPTIDTFGGAWSLGIDTDPSGLWLSTDFWNLPRWYNEESDRLIKEGVSIKALDFDYRKQIYADWQKIVNEEVPMIFLNSPLSIAGLNKRVNGHTFSEAWGISKNRHLWWVSKENQ